MRHPSIDSPQMIRSHIYPPTVCQFRARRKLSTQLCHPLMTKTTKLAGNRQVIISAQHHFLVTGRSKTSWMSACRLQTKTERANLYLGPMATAGVGRHTTVGRRRNETLVWRIRHLLSRMELVPNTPPKDVLGRRESSKSGLDCSVVARRRTNIRVPTSCVLPRILPVSMLVVTTFRSRGGE